MNKYFITMLLRIGNCYLAISNSLVQAQEQPFPGMKNVTEWVHAIDEKDNIRNFNHNIYFKNDWFAALERQPVSWGIPKEITYEEIKYINDKANKTLKAQLDEVTYGLNDYTATPFESLFKKAGDCEDYTILKYYWLAELGAKPERMNVYSGYYIKGMKIPIAHNILAIKDNNGNEWILDIMNDKPIRANLYMNKDFMPKHRIDNKRVSIW